MYIPAAFRVESPGKLTGLIRDHSFATLVTHDGGSCFASHLPMLYEPDAGSHGILVAHMARANPQWRHFAKRREALAIFHGPHAYISPSWYRSSPAVPTWNYATVHAYGVPAVIEDPGRLASLIDKTVETYEQNLPEPWEDRLPDEFRAGLMKAIVGFEIPVSRIEGKFKLGQNRSDEDLRGVYDALSGSPDSCDKALAGMMVSEGYVSERPGSDLGADRDEAPANNSSP